MRFVLLVMMACFATVQTQAIEIPTPPNAQEFGAQVAFLDNGNIVITAPGYDLPGAADVGAVFLYRPNGTLISTLTGSTAGDRVGQSYGSSIIKLRNGHFVVRSIAWARNANAPGAGAVTWFNANTGLNGVVSASNSLVGSATDDRVGAYDVIALSNGHYVVSSCNWSGISALKQYGATTWGNGNGGTVGEVSAANSLTGSIFGDGGECRVYALANGHYAVANRQWSNAGQGGAGAVTWGNGMGGTVGAVSVANSIVGAWNSDSVGLEVVVLRNGNFVTATKYWDDVVAGPNVDSGAVTWMRGTGPTSGAVSSSNSLIGDPQDQVGTDVTALSNGHYVVLSPGWGDFAHDVGAVTWGNGVTGTVGRVSASNSLLGARAGDFIGLGAGYGGQKGAVALSNGHYVVNSPRWNAGNTLEVGAVTWVDGNGPRVGQVSAGNSLVGSAANDRVGSAGVVALTNGHYVVASDKWDHLQTPDVGAATWRNGNGPSPGVVVAGNSLIGTLAGDSRRLDIVALKNGHYVVGTPDADLGTSPPVRDVGAVTWCSGTGVTSAVVSTTNSFVGLAQADLVGDSVLALSNGNYVVGSVLFDAFGMSNLGAVTWGNGNAPSGAFLGVTNSLIGRSPNDTIGYIDATSDGGYVVIGPYFDDYFATDGGMIAFGQPDGSTVGTTPAAISVLGATPGGGVSMVYDYDAARERLLVGLPADNRVVIVSTNPNLLFGDGFE